MIPRLLCGVLAMAVAGPCSGQEPPITSPPASQAVVSSDRLPLTPSGPQPVVGVPRGTAYTNRGSSGNYCTCCGPGTQYMATDCCLRLDLSNGIGLCDPCNRWRPHPAPSCCYGCR